MNGDGVVAAAAATSAYTRTPLEGLFGSPASSEWPGREGAQKRESDERDEKTHERRGRAFSSSRARWLACGVVAQEGSALVFVLRLSCVCVRFKATS
jgi:hypothetical protein